ncbi:heavy metal translocating P-type ATPase [Desulfoferrobacter suflitae]|uniref:heavy metal translocating P-type ATPase n=1 Tax=Desulfoferrobacter suflitae TaxID=2865782 RepID=UPI0021649442|nr:heavy metal translocating P-type ATPase [Desulfoferrobacter suflitae]MCK8604194.1 cadmium-translocating P-type ATPase [Desulfoferrobacter suflitae]MDD3815864.1 heavy metal translocating P-type ATPase [Desulfocapsaceae bacterium]
MESELRTTTWEGRVAGLDCADCAATLAKDIEKLEGVKSASLNFAVAKLTVEYDPKLLGLERIEKELKRAGYRLEQMAERHRLVLLAEDMCCADEASIVEKQLRKLPGVADLQFNTVAGEITVEYELGRLNPDQIMHAVSATGVKAKFKGRDEPIESFWETRKHEILTAVSAILILTAFIGSRAGLGHSVTDPLYILAILAGGYFIAKKGLLALRTLNLDMNFLMTIAVIGAAAIEEWLEASAIVILFSLANILQNYTMNRARNAIRSLMEISPTQVVVRRNGGEEKAAIEEVQLGETIIVRPGERIGLDGRVLQGSSHVNQAPITGESMPVEKNPGDVVFAGTVNQQGSLELEVTHDYRDTTLARIIHMVEEAQAQRAPSQSFVDKFAAVYTPAVIAAALLVALVPPIAFGLPFTSWFYRALVLLVISCPCALVISTPVSIVSGLTTAARRGVLIKGGAYLEAAGSLKVMAFDKTGTLTRGIPKVTRVIPLNGHSEQEVLRIAAAVESRSEHHLAAAIVEAAQSTGIAIPPTVEFQAIAGKGAQARINGKLHTIGSHRFLEEAGLCNGQACSGMLQLENERKTAVIVADETGALGILAIADEVRPESESALQELRSSGVEKIVMLTGDNEGTAQAIAENLSIDDFYAELLPADKAAIVSQLVQTHGKVAMVGDGVNDAPPMAAADIGIAMGAIGTDTALETADIALMTDDLSRLPFLIRLSRRTLRIIKQNIAFSLLVKAVFIGLAIPGLATLWMAVGADMGASLLVIFNGLRLLAQRDVASAAS